MQIVWTILLGLAAGIIAKFIYPGRQNMGADRHRPARDRGFVRRLLRRPVAQDLSARRNRGFIGSVVGALVILFVYSLFKKKAV